MLAVFKVDQNGGLNIHALFLECGVIIFQQGDFLLPFPEPQLLRMQNGGIHANWLPRWHYG